MDSVRDELLGVFAKTKAYLAPERAAAILEMIECGEEVVALEILCSNLLEDDATIGPEVLTRIASLAKALGIAESKWSGLR